ncbi:hypothetical protein GMSM_42690 [Geomonas sp. Red276]
MGVISKRNRIGGGNVLGLVGASQGVAGPEAAGSDREGVDEGSGPREVAETPPSLPPAAGRLGGEARKSPTTERVTVKVSFELERGMHLRLKLASVRQGETIAGMVSRWVEENTPEAR